MSLEDLDIDMASADPEMVEAEIEHQLHLKGYCVVGSALDEELLMNVLDDIKTLKVEARFQPPPKPIIDGLLGAEGSAEIAHLTLPEDEGYADGEHLRVLDEGLSGLAENCTRFLESVGHDMALRSPSVMIRGGTCDFDGPELTEEMCSHWMTTFNQAKLMLLLFIGPNNTTLELQPYSDDESGIVEIQTKANTMVICRCDVLSRRHFSSSMDYTLCCWITSPEALAGPRGWLSSNRNVARVMPVARELEDWAQARMEKLYMMELEGTLDESSVPREWLRMMRHCYFKKTHTPAGVFGQSGHLPGQHNSEAFWNAMIHGADLLREIPQIRWDHTLYYDKDPNSWMQSQFFAGGVTKTAVKHCSFVDGIEYFDNKFFGISLREARGMEPMQRHILETSYECLFDAGMRRKALDGADIAVYTGSSFPEFAYVKEQMDEHSVTGTSQSMLSNRTSFLLGLKGPSSSIDCEMASSAMALKLGAESVSHTNERRTASGQDSTAACCGGVYFSMTPMMWARHGAFMNHRGRCFTFDSSAAGYVRGEMCGSMCLKPYAESLDEELAVSEDFCYGTIAGWGITNNGRSASITAPCGPAEQEACHAAVRHAGIDPLDVDGQECHGIGGLLADGVEVTCATHVLRGGERDAQEILVLGAVKTHMGAACEACGVFQFAMILFNILYGTNIPSVHLRQVNPHMELGSSSLLNSENVAYRDRSVFHGIASRGWGGSNVNLVLWYSADKTKVMEKPDLDRQDFPFWPGGGGFLSGDSRPLHCYYILGSWSTGGVPEPMQRMGNGCYKFTVTLGTRRYETFQICLDGEDDRVLHPYMGHAPSGSAAAGPSDVIDAQGLHWKIEGRELTFDREGLLALDNVANSTADSRRQSGVLPTRDSGNPGDQYEVQLRIAGKYRAVTWQKVKTVEESMLTQEMLGGSYYIVGSFTDWSFQEMKPSADVPGLFTAEVGPLPFRGGEFQISRNKDWDQMFYPAAGSEHSGAEVKGPDDMGTGLFWSLRPTSTSEVFQVEFQRSVDQGKDVRRLTWNAKQPAL